MKIRVDLNGTTVNPFRQMGLTQNPFPQIPVAGIAPMCIRLQSLGCEPIPNVDHIRQTLIGFTDEFVQLLCDKFQPGKYVSFYVEWPS